MWMESLRDWTTRASSDSTTRCGGRRSASWKALALMMLGLSSCCADREPKYANYDECVLGELKSGQTSSAAAAIERSCRQLYAQWWEDAPLAPPPGQ